MTPLSRMEESLRALRVEAPSIAPMIDVFFISAIRIFRNLVDLNVDSYCRGERCAFELDDDNVTELAVALPQLESLLLGYPCDKNTCVAMVICLLHISVHSIKVEKLGIHFNATNIVGDLKAISVDPRFQEFLLLPRCQLQYLGVTKIPLVLDESDFETVLDGMRSIFPSLRGFSGSNVWGELSRKM